MMDKQFQELLNEFSKSARCVSALQEDILSLHEVMEGLQETAQAFSDKNCLAQLLPQLYEHMAGAGKVYEEVAGSIQTIGTQLSSLKEAGEGWGSQLTAACRDFEEQLPAIFKLQEEILQLRRETAEMLPLLQAEQEELRQTLTDIKELTLENRRQQQELQAALREESLLKTFAAQLTAGDADAQAYFAKLCQEWQEQHLNAALERWAQEQLGELTGKKNKNHSNLPWK